MKRFFSLPGHEGNRTEGEGDEQYGNEEQQCFRSQN